MVRPQRSDEERRNLKVDVRRIPEWTAELEGIRSKFRSLGMDRIYAAALLVLRVRETLYGGLGMGAERQKLEKWKKNLSPDNLIRLRYDFSAPDFVSSGPSEDLVEAIQITMKRTQEALLDYQRRGVTDSFWVSLFTSKVRPDSVQLMSEQELKCQALLKEIPNIKSALGLLAQVRAMSEESLPKVLKLEKHLSLAIEKKEALERFEKKYGKAFAKAATVDKTTRSRATSLKRLVRRTDNCPYCGGPLGKDPHLDHIYPVGKGGLGIPENLLWCCADCNADKADKGLMQFLKKRNISIEDTVARLQAMGKHV